MTEGQLRASEWYLSHKLALKKTLMGAIIAVGAIFWIYSLYGFIDWKFVSGPKERANLKTILEIKTANEANGPRLPFQLLLANRKFLPVGSANMTYWSKPRIKIATGGLNLNIVS